MNPNPIPKKSEFKNKDKVVILHTNDIGICQASLSAFINLWENESISSGAIMLRCPWAKPAAEYCRTHIGVDKGVQVTFNAEWDGYRWPALSTRDPFSGLMDKDGFPWQTSQEIKEHATPEVVMVELQLQVHKALERGVDVRHVDTHMDTVAQPKFLPAYDQVAIQARISVMLPRGDVRTFLHEGIDREMASEFATFTAQLEKQGLTSSISSSRPGRPGDRVPTPA